MKIETIHQSDRELLWKVKRHDVLAPTEERSSVKTLAVYM
jgi:hypothetical protein